MDFIVKGGNDGSEITLKNERVTDGVFYIDVCVKYDKPVIPEKFSIRWYYPTIDCYSIWNSSSGARNLGPNWYKQKINSRLASCLPFQSLISLSGKNRIAIAVSDAFIPITVATGVLEEGIETECYVDFFTMPTAAIEEYKATIRIDTRDIPYYDSIYDAVKWWETECGYTPASVPEYAKLPMNSLWYSFHQQLDAEKIVEQCRLSKPLGMHTVIVDDGWQTDDNNRGYAYCGDWELATSKIPDMKELVDRVHDIGMKMMVWYSVPYIGVYSKNFEKFKDMRLDDNPKRKHWPLDPRYKEVRDFLISIYTDAVKNWGLDGLKLDFIDDFKFSEISLKSDDRRDYTSLEQAINVLMKDVYKELHAINPDILIEFRQSYIGPAIRQYGNMLRVADCPADAIRNRDGVVDLRFTSGNTAVHSDMLVWNYNEPVESAAEQLTNILYSVPQISVMIDKLTKEHYNMLKYYLSFWTEWRDVLLDGKLTADNPECHYSYVCSKLGEKAVVTLYTQNAVDNVCSEFAVVNATGRNSVYVKNCVGKTYKIVNCMGDEVCHGTFGNEKISELNVPLSAIIFIK